MIEKGKTALLFLLVVLSLYQSYLLAYSKPLLEVKVKTELDYVKAEPLGDEQDVKDLIFPEQMVIHLGEDKHTVFYPNTSPFYKLILEKLKVREFKGLQRDSRQSVDWDLVRRENQGVELRFAKPVPFELLQKAFKIDGDFLFYKDSIDRIWIYTSKLRDEVRTFFFSADGRNVYEAQKADLTVGDVEGYVGFGQYWDPYTIFGDDQYVPERPIARMLEMEVAFTRYTTEQMKDNLFIDPDRTRTIPSSQPGATFYTDSKRGLKIEQDGTWLSYTDTVAPTEGDNDPIDNLLAAVSFVNQHGGWNGTHLLVREVGREAGSELIRFQQYYRETPLVADAATNFGYMQLTMKQGLVTSYNRSIVVLDNEVKNKKLRELPGGEPLREILKSMGAGGGDVEAIFPAYRPILKEDSVVLSPVWAARLANGEVKVVAESAPATGR
ncbi:YycH family regulatory protein [Paenibacillaceae bacterium WGS1546]|uniref:YycH family regulatory protein n=1 Tax=Cohnella sp. WGS1546 TaxID=3366810 RepID=UPI00372D1332